MPPPTNISALTATDLGSSLPVSTSQSGIHDAGTTETVWFKFTPTETGVFGAWFFGDLVTYTPRTRTWLGPAAAPVAYVVDTGTTHANKPVQVPCTAGVTYYFQIIPNAGNPTPATVTISLVAQPTDAVAEGDIAVNDDTTGFPLAIIDPSTGAIKRFFQPFPNGEAGDVLTSGVSLVADEDTNEVVLFDAEMAEITRLALNMPGLGGSIRTNQTTQRFWVAYTSGATRLVKPVTSTGTVGTAHTLTAIGNVTAIASNAAETVLYHTPSTAGAAIAQWDLVNDVALSDLVAGTANYAIFDLLVMADDTILACESNTVTSDVRVRRFDDTGAVLNTYSFGTANAFPAGTRPRLAYAINDPVSFWIWRHPDAADEGLSVFENVTVSTGAVATTVESVEYETGVYNRDATATPEARFGNSFSCPFWIIRSSITPPFPDFVNGPEALAAFEASGVLRGFDVPRVRIAPHLADENQRIFYSRFELDVETGVGTVTGQGVDPVVLMRYSNDGGFTWSTWQQLTVGPLGKYRYRCDAWLLGMARDRVFMIRQTDPVKSAWLAAYLDFTESSA